MKIVADDKIPFLKGALEPYAEVVYLPGRKLSKIFLRMQMHCLSVQGQNVMRSCLAEQKSDLLATATIGFDHIDTQYCDKNNIKWTNAPDAIHHQFSNILQLLAENCFRIQV